MNGNHDSIDPKVKAAIIKKYLETPKGRTKLAAAMVQPLKHRMSMGSVASRAFTTEPIVSKCPECNQEFQGMHPEDDCPLGHVYNIMEV